MIDRYRLALTGFLLTVFPTSVHADDGVDLQVETSVASNYVYRGIVQYASRRTGSSQNTVSLRLDHVGAGALTFVAWNAVALSDYDAQPGNALEFDLFAAYAFPAGPFAITAGYMAYLYPNHMAGAPVDGAHEVSAVASYDNKYVVPTVGTYVEFARQQGIYLMAGGSRDFHFGPWTLSPMVSAGAATYRKYLGSNQAASPHLNDVTAAVSTRLEIDKGVYATAKVSYSFRGTPSDLLPMDMGWGFEGRSSVFGVLALGITR